MDRFEHGGDLDSLQLETPFAGELLDFSANLNPLGMPEGVVQALRDGVESFEAYPDPHCRALTGAIAQKEGVPEEYVLACAGATDAIARLCSAIKPKQALVCAPCYSGYEQALEQVGAHVSYHGLSEERGFVLSEEIIDDISRGTDVLFLASPNNPTGLTIERCVLERVVKAARERGAFVVLDECFIEFTERESATGLLSAFDNLAIVKAFTKSYAIAGLRLGYLLCANEPVMQRCEQAGQLWTVSTPAQIAGLAALREKGYLEESRAYVARERARLVDALSGFGLRVVPSEANYLLFKSERPLYEPLLERGIVIRRCENYIGLDDTWFRVAVRTNEENERLVAALKEVIA